MNLKRLAMLFLYAAAAAYFLRLLAVEGIYIASGSMEPSLPVGRHALVDKLTLRFRAPRRSEVVLLSEPVPPYTEMVKRVAAVAGDTIELRDKKVYLNGEPVEEPYVQHTRKDERLKGDNLGPLTVPEDHVFVLGDNRDESNDSTVWRDPASGEPAPFVPFSRVRGLVRGIF